MPMSIHTIMQEVTHQGGAVTIDGLADMFGADRVQFDRFFRLLLTNKKKILELTDGRRALEAERQQAHQRQMIEEEERQAAARREADRLKALEATPKADLVRRLERLESEAAARLAGQEGGRNE